MRSLETASTAAGDQASIGCAYSAVPSQAQAASGGAGAIACASGSGGNTEVSPLSSLFPEPLSGYQLSSTSPAVNSVPVSAISLPFGLTPSSTDLAGNPRSESVSCVALQDKGALQLQGHSSPCLPPVLVLAKPVVGVIGGLTISPGSFFAAPKGATTSRAKKRKYGAKITYSDSQAGTTTFTVLRPSSGRRQGRSCKKPSKRNRYGKRCTLLTKVGSFTHVDTAGADSLRFSGRIKGRKLPGSSYTLQAVPHDAAGNGAAVRKSFRIR